MSSDTEVVVTLGEESVSLPQGTNLLSGLTEKGVEIPASCRAGVCQSCMMRSEEAPPARAQKGLKESLKQEHYFLACQCEVEQSMQCSFADDVGFTGDAQIVDTVRLSSDVVRVRLEKPEGFSFRGGQFVNVQVPGLPIRSYSIASLPGDGPYMDLHVRRVPGGAVSGYMHETIRPGDSIAIRGPQGDCFYVSGDPEEPLVLAGTGTGLAPLWAVARDALAHGHRGPITLYHGALTAERIYFSAEAHALAQAHENLRYVPCLFESQEPTDTLRGELRFGALDDVVVGDWHGQKEARAYLCGDPGLVERLRKKLFLGGLSYKRIHADAFVMAAAS